MNTLGADGFTVAKGDGKGIRVRGACPDGHVSEGHADSGRVTWDGPCPEDGCEKQVRRSRVKASQQDPPPPAKTDPAPDSSKLIVKKAEYADAPPKQHPDDEPADPSTDPGGEHEPDHVGGSPGVQPPARGPAGDDDGGGEAPAGGTPDNHRRRFGRRRAPRAGTRYPGVPY